MGADTCYIDAFAQQAGAEKPCGFHFVQVQDLCIPPISTPWVVKGYLDKGSLCCIFGESGSMKTFLSTDFGLSIAASLKEWHGNPIRVSGPVFCIIGEGFSGMNCRIKAWAIHHNVNLDGVPFFISNRPARFLEKEGTVELVQAVDELIKEHGTPVLVVIDTLNRNFGPGDENSTADMTRFICAIDDALRSRYQCAVLIIHHTGLTATERARGASALRAALDWEYRLQKNANGSRTLTCTKAKDHAEPEPISFMPEEITIEGWIDPDDGEVMTSCILRPSEGVSRESKPLKGARKIAFDALMEAGSGEPSHIDKWREYAYASGISPTSSIEAKKKAFQRAVSDLREAGYVETINDLWWPKKDRRDISSTLCKH